MGSTNARRGGKRVLLGAFDQALSSLGNFVFTIVGALLLDAVSFGQIALIFAIYLIMNGLVRSLTSDVYIVSAHDTEKEVSSSEAACVETCVVIATFMGAVAAVAAVAVPSMRGPLLILGVCLPLLSLQDTLRYIAFGRARPGLAVVSDAIWTAATLGVVGVLAALDNASVVSLVAAWAGTGAIAGVLAFAMMRFPLSVLTDRRQAQRIRGWLSEHRNLYPYYVIDTVALLASGPMVLFLLTGISGLAAGGALRAAQLLFNPAVVLVSSVRIWAIPELVRARAHGGRKWRLRSMQLIVLLTVVCAFWSAGVVFAPSEIIHKLLGDSAVMAQNLLWPTAVLTVVTGGVATPIFALIRSLGEAIWGLCARLISAAVMLAASAVGAVLSGAYGAAWGLALVMPVVGAIWIYALRRSMGRAQQGQIIEA